MEACGTARVVRVYGDRAEVVVERPAACGHCQTSDLCDAFSSRGVVQVEVDNPVGARAGQQVEIGSARSPGLKVAFMVYLLPALLFLVGVVVAAELLHFPPWAAGLCGFAMLAVSWLLARAYDRSAGRRPEFRLAITRIVAAAPPAAEEPPSP